MSVFTQFSPTFHNFLNLERKWMEYRAANLLYYPSDPRWKGLTYWKQHSQARNAFEKEKNLLWAQLTDLECYVLDPTEETGLDWFRNMYELKILLRKGEILLQNEWPDPWCHIIGHLRSAEECAARFTCLNCWKSQDRIPSDNSYIVGGPDEAWITEALNRYAETRDASKSAAARGVSGPSFQPESSVANVQEETPISILPGSNPTGSESRRQTKEIL